MIAVVIVAALASFVWVPFDPTAVNASIRLQGSSSSHILGTDSFGHDVFSVILEGSRATLLVGLLSVAIAAAIGVPIGVCAGMAGKRLGGAVMSANDILQAFPALLIAIIVGAVWGAGIMTAVVALGIGTAAAFARVSRSGTMQVMSREYISAARAAGRGRIFIAWRHVLPNIGGILVVQASVNFAVAVLAEAALSYLGLGTPPPTPSWGRMLQESQTFVFSSSMLVVWPGIAIAWTVLGFNILGDGLRDYFDPRRSR
ncbi:ABC transporter permease [Gordonia jinhuaensis]|uniref:Peptide ABC transporter permease n=1 Tax=Gordonia jinhuaensis TaxID=1517702 RepID=A0A916TBQ2_9ACTN|nr:ABC transporter permease [Gordonia jinhuaensis]GGB38476.1 peptide ABC transporter permease [Gordonia jinhuaensis]